MSVNDLDYAGVRALERPASGRRHRVGLLTASIDALSTLLVVPVVSLGYHGLAYGATGDLRLTAELALTLAAIFVAINWMRDRYRLDNYLAARGQIADAFSAWTLTLAIFVAVAFVAGDSDDYSRAVVVATWIVGAPLLVLARSVAVSGIATASRSGRLDCERVFLIGREAEVMALAGRHRSWTMGCAIVDVAFLRDARGNGDPRTALAADLASATARCRQLRPDAVFIAMPWSEPDAVEACVDAFMNLPVAIHLAPERIMDRFDSPHVARIGSMASLRLTRPAMSTGALMLKRCFDVAAAGTILLVSAPLLALIALAIRLDSKGPVLFVQRRYGFNQDPFRIVKFRTMSTTDDGDVIRQAKADDPRITRVGRYLRRYNLDELPQLLNVLRGEMSLVGPRPHALAHDREFERRIARYARRHNVKPGITGWAQVNGFRGETDTDEKMASRIACDHWYIDNWSFWLDLAILVRTVVSPRSYANAR